MSSNPPTAPPGGWKTNFDANQAYATHQRENQPQDGQQGQQPRQDKEPALRQEHEEPVRQADRPFDQQHHERPGMNRDQMSEQRTEQRSVLKTGHEHPKTPSDDRNEPPGWRPALMNDSATSQTARWADATSTIPAASGSVNIGNVQHIENFFFNSGLGGISGKKICLALVLFLFLVLCGTGMLFPEFLGLSEARNHHREVGYAPMRGNPLMASITSQRDAIASAPVPSEEYARDAEHTVYLLDAILETAQVGVPGKFSQEPRYQIEHLMFMDTYALLAWESFEDCDTSGIKLVNCALKADLEELTKLIDEHRDQQLKALGGIKSQIVLPCPTSLGTTAKEISTIETDICRGDRWEVVYFTNLRGDL